MCAAILIEDLAITVVKKNIKTIRLSVHPPLGTVRMSAPRRVPLATLQGFAQSKLGWIRQQQARLRATAPEPAQAFVDQESLSVWGRRCLLRVVERHAAPRITLEGDHILLSVRPGTDRDRKAALLENWYRAQLRHAIPPLIAKWEPVMGVRVQQYHLQRMKTRWGSCNIRRQAIRLNTELARKPPACLEYVVVHEMVHLLEPSHNQRFKNLMTTFLPDWKTRRATLNGLTSVDVPPFCTGVMC
jgi:predicted metal-dependent hydrolase